MEEALGVVLKYCTLRMISKFAAELCTWPRTLPPNVFDCTEQ